jgi:PAS domain S-box-containing protein
MNILFGILISLFTLSNSLAEASNDTKLLFLGNKNIAPVVYLDDTSPSGVAVDIVRALANHIPQPIEIKAMDWSEAQALVARGEADALIQINQTEERKKIYDFSDTLLESQFSIFTRTDKMGISGLSSLRGLQVGVESGGLPRQVLERDPRILLNIITNFLEGFKRLNEGSIDAVVVDYRVGSFIIAENKLRNIKVTGEPIAFSYSSFAVKKGNTKLLNEINHALQMIKADGTYQNIIDNWKPKEVVFQTREQITQRIYYGTMLIILILFLIGVIWMVTLKRELTKRKAAEEKLGERYSTLRSIINSANAHIFSVDRQYCYSSFNQGHAAAMNALYGAQIEQGRSLLDYMTVTEDRETAKRNLDRALAGELVLEESYSGEELRSRQYFQVSHSPIKTETGEVIGVAVLAQNMTERKRAEEALKRIEWMLSKKHTSIEGEEDGHDQGYGDLTALNHDGVILKSVGRDVLRSIAADYLDLLGTSSAIYELNGDYAFGIFSSKWCRMLDRASRKLCDTDDNAAALISGQWLCHESCWTRCSKDAIATRAPVDIECSGGIRLYGVPIVAGETVIGSINFGYGDIPDDPVKLLELANAYHLNYEDLLAEFNAYDSRPPYIVEMAKSRLHASARLIGILVERNWAEEKIRKLNQELEQRVVERTAQLEAANRELEAFCFSVSHDLRAPLRHIDGYADLLVSRCRDGLNDNGLHYVDTIAASARQMGVLIDDLLQFSRTGRAEMRRERLDMNQALQEALTPFKESHAERSIEWVIGELPLVRGDFALLRQVWANLLENAVKYTRKRKVARIEVSAREGSGEIIFVVSDNGVGFDMQYVGKLFGVFQRLHSQEEFEGTGIGLATVQRIITRHGGLVWAEAEPNRGAAFYFTLPDIKEGNHA